MKGIRNITNTGNKGITDHICFCAMTISLELHGPTHISTVYQGPRPEPHVQVSLHVARHCFYPRRCLRPCMGEEGWTANFCVQSIALSKGVGWVSSTYQAKLSLKLQVSGTFSEEWCGHLAWRENTLSRNLIAKLVGHLVENDVDTLHEERIHLVGTNYIGHIDID